MHHHGHDHEHHHHAPLDVSNISRMLVFGMILNLVYVAVEFIAGIFTGSLALIADAGHNFSDASGLFLAWLAFRLMRIRSTKNNTYGQRKTSILLSLINSLLIVAAVAVIFNEAIHRFYRPAEFDGYTVSIVAAVGVGVNFLTAFLLFRDRKKDINVKGAYLHMLADGLVSVGVIISGIIIRLTHLSWIDPVVSIVIGLVVLYSTWDLLKESLRMTVDALPRNIDLEDVKKKIGSVKGVLGVHHIHIWAISTSENAMTGHVLIAADTTPQQVESIKHNIRHQLEHLQIVHSTLEMEYTGALCEHKNC